MYNRRVNYINILIENIKINFDNSLVSEGSRYQDMAVQDFLPVPYVRQADNMNGLMMAIQV